MFDEKLAYKCLYFMNKTFHPGQANKWLSDVEFFDVRDVQGFTGVYRGRFVVVFKATDSAFDWIRNLALFMKTIPYGNHRTPIRLHYGFYRAYLAVRKLIHQRFEESYCAAVLTTGHSLGAALAVLCAVDLQYNCFGNVTMNKELVYCYNMGMPRVGNEAFCRSYNRRVPRTYRIVCGGDIATKLPWEFLGYRHIDNEVVIGRQMPVKFFGCVRDHYPCQYEKALLKKYFRGGLDENISY